MKNKLITKIIIVVVCISTLLVTFVVPSFAYTFDNTSAYNNNYEQFTLPLSQVILSKHSPSLDGPAYIYVPISDYYARGSETVCAFNSVQGRFVVSKNVVGSNVYENNGYLQDAYISINHDYEIYDLYGIRISEWWLDGNAIDSIYNSLTFTLHSPDLLKQYVMEGDVIYWDRFIEVLPIRYYINYLDLDGNQSTLEFGGRLIPSYVSSDSSGSVYEVNVRYLPSSLYTPYYDDFGSSIQLNQTYSIDLSNIAYIKSLAIYIGEDGLGGTYDNGFFGLDDDGTSIIGHYVNRLNLPNYPGDVFDTVLGNVGGTYYEDGYEAGNTAGYNTGYEVGNTEGYNTGYEAGNAEGYDDGYDEGYIAGIAEGSDGIVNPFGSVISAVNTFLDWEFIPGISVSVVLSVVIGISLLITFLKVFAGG